MHTTKYSIITGCSCHCSFGMVRLKVSLKGKNPMVFFRGDLKGKGGKTQRDVPRHSCWGMIV